MLSLIPTTLKVLATIVAFIKVRGTMILFGLVLLCLLSTLLVIRGGAPRYKIEQISQFTYNALIVAVVSLIVMLIILAVILML